MIKTDNPALVGLHVFERAGLGVAPFRCVGTEWRTYSPAPGIEMVGGSCDYCSTGIKLFCYVEGRDGRRFKVGSDCIAKTGDAGLIRSYKSRPEVRKAARDARKARDTAKTAEWNALMADPAVRTKLAARMIPVPAWRGGGAEPWLTALEFVWPRCGAAGRHRYLRSVKKFLETGQ